jgi:MFS family permease/nitroreductase
MQAALSQSSMRAPLWRQVLTPGLVALYGVAFLSGFSLGVFNPLVALLMSEQGISDTWIGLTATAYFLVIAVAAHAVARALVRVSLPLVITTGLLVSAAIALILPLANGLPEWIGLRIALGLAVCLYVIGGQTGLNYAAGENVRATAAALHGGAFGLGFALSPVIGSFLYLISPSAAFRTAAFLIASGAVLVAFRLPRIRVEAPASGRSVSHRVRLPAFAGFTYGFFEGAFVALFSIYLLRQGVSIAQGGVALSLFVVGGVLGMGPISFWGDRLGRERMLAAAALTGVGAILVLVLRADATGSMIGATLLGLSLGPVFPLALAMIGARLPKTELAAGSSVFTAWFAYGCAAGPLVAAGAMSVMGPPGLFAGTFALLIFLAIWAYRARHEYPPPRLAAETDSSVTQQSTFMTSQTPIFTRRGFLAGCTVVVGGAAGSAYAIGELGKPDPSAEPYEHWHQRSPRDLSDLQFIAMCGVLAANPHNTQPWRFRIESDLIEIRSDEDRHLGSADPERRMMKMALGCALDNMMIAARSLGYLDAREIIEPDSERILLNLGSKSATRSGTAPEDALFEAIFARQTVRAPFDPTQPVPFALTAALSQRAAELNISLRWYREPSLRDAIAEVHRSGVRAWMAEPQRHVDAMKWWRHTRQQWHAQRDGISIYTSALPAFFRAAGPVLVSREQLEGDFGREQEIGWVDSIVQQTPVWAVMHAPRDDWASCVNAGRLLERMYLEATRTGYGLCPLAYAAEHPDSSERLKTVLNIPEREHVFIACRLGQGPQLERSVRRELTTFITQSS